MNDPADLAELVVRATRPLLVGLDIDGVLAPIVDHADDSRLLDGVARAIDQLLGRDDITLAAVSGRSLASIHTFGLPTGMILVGGHGMELEGEPIEPLDIHERALLAQLRTLAEAAATEAGDGAWVEDKTASVALHVRQADHTRGAAALASLSDSVSRVAGAEMKHGSEVLELFARTASKGSAMTMLQHRTGASTSVFVGDDVTDEEAFAVLGPSNIRIKVGDADTIAEHRLPDPHAVLVWLRTLGARLAD